MEIKQYEIVLVNLDPTIGSELQKTRPCIVISPNEMNKYLSIVVIAPLTSSSKPYPTRVQISQSKTKGWVVLDQIRTVDKQRIVTKFGELTQSEIHKIKQVIQETYVD